ncbi:MAG: hypothetical protein LBU89_07875 [Fibromonadaceae bacterium]|jgi:uncharacterized protein (TIGR02145 family)|nr:hypothetical protein [Fibromonadaceae bacterium]
MKKIVLLVFLAFTCVAFAQKAQKKTTRPSAATDIKGRFTDVRDKKQYRTVKVGSRVWMAEDLNFKSPKGKLYSFGNVQKACPAGWRLPSKSAWEDLKKEISEADAKLKAQIGWSTQGRWWAVTNSGVNAPVYYTVVNSGFGGINELKDPKSANLAVRCIQNTRAKPSEKRNDIKLYKTVKIGSQTWMAENLNFKTGKSWCYENDDYNCNMYGRLYDWSTAVKACPSGWRLPTRREWNEVKATELSTMLGGNLNSEFSHAVPVNEYKFLDREGSGNWWGNTEYGNSDAYSWHIKANEKNLDEKVSKKNVGYSVRCVRNIPGTNKANNIRQYKTVKIGNQVWMAENLNHRTGKSWCFEDDEFYCKKYGRLYDWNTATKACPVGWHLPSDLEWNELESVAGKDVASAISASQGGWRDNEAHEFTLERQRSGEKTGRWRNLNESGFWWSSTIFEITGSAQVRQLSSESFSSTLRDKPSGLSIRCIQDLQPKKISRTFTDTRDSKQYGVAVIGNAIWMKNNLNHNAKGSFCYENKSENCDKYGRLYEWDLANTVCPTPWRLPNNDDWVNLIESSGSSVAGKKLKSKQRWNGTDNYGFSALPGGFTRAQGFAESGEKGYWWTSNDYGPNAGYKSMSSDRDSIAHSGYPKSTGLSVRCVQDCGPFKCVVE